MARVLSDLVRRSWVGPAIAAVLGVAVVAEVLRTGGGVTGSALASSWQLVDLPVLRDDPLGSVWYLHTQPPVHNLVVGAIAASPLPEAGTLFALYAGCLISLAVVLALLGTRLGLPPIGAGVVGGLAVANPGLLHTITLASYEVPLALGLALLALLVERHAERATFRSFVAVAGVVTVLTMTRSVLHPLWLIGVLAVVAVARPVGRRALVVGIAIPLLVVGGWMVKNTVVFGVPTLSSWDGFNLQRGVSNPMERSTVRSAVAAGEASPLALERPWLHLDEYEGLGRPCDRRHDHPAVARSSNVVRGVEVANFNDECYLPLYARARRDALALIRADPGTYLARRRVALSLSHENPRGVSFLGDAEPRRSWMDRLYDPVLLQQELVVDTSRWNRSLLGHDLRMRLSWTLLAISLVVVTRTGRASLRVVVGRRRGTPLPPLELVWLVIGGTHLFVVLGGALVELGENGRFRSMLDPVVLVLVIVEAVRFGHRCLGTRTVGLSEGGALSPSPAQPSS